MVVTIISGKKHSNGFTFIELIVVLTVVALLASVAAPIVSNAIIKARESTLKENLYLLRKSLDDYYTDNGKYPDALEVLVEKHYLRKIPMDPITDSHTNWLLTFSKGEMNEQGIIDIHSSSTQTASDGSQYANW